METHAQVAAALGDRPFRYYRALLSTEADALAWARAGGPHGAVVAAGRQGVPRGRGGIPWTLDFDRDLCFSMILRRPLPPEREGWLYVAVLLAVARELPGEVRIAWPDELRRDGDRIGAVGVQAQLAPGGVDWAVATISVLAPDEPRADLLARLAAASEATLEQPDEEVLRPYRDRCATLGRRVAVTLAGAPADVGVVRGAARTVREDGALSIERDDGRGVAVLPSYVRTIAYDPTSTADPGRAPPPGG